MRRSTRSPAPTAQYYNNLGYSYMLRGNLTQALINFRKAKALAPDSPVVANNMQMLSNATRRAPFEPWWFKTHRIARDDGDGAIAVATVAIGDALVMPQPLLGAGRTSDIAGGHGPAQGQAQRCRGRDG